MSESLNTQKVQEIFAAFGQGDIPGILSHIAENVDWTVPGSEAIPYAGNYKGHDGAVQFFTRLGGALDYEAFEPREFVAQGDHVVVLGLERGRAKSTGKTFEMPWALVFTFKEGKVVRFRSFEDTEAVAAAFK